jgi:predicted acyltransferase
MNFSSRHQYVLAAVCLIGYWAVLTLVPVPGSESNVLTQQGNLGSYIDRNILGLPHLDSEGFLSTGPAVITVLIGYWTGEGIRSKAGASHTTVVLLLAGVVCLAVGGAWHLVFPMIKRLWTSSYVVFTVGGALVTLALCHELVEVRRLRRVAQLFEVFGRNALFVYVCSSLVESSLRRLEVTDAGASIAARIHEAVFAPLASPRSSSLVFAVSAVLAWWLVAWFMFRRRWFVTV